MENKEVPNVRVTKKIWYKGVVVSHEMSSEKLHQDLGAKPAKIHKCEVIKR